jgi:hypothetical protein
VERKGERGTNDRDPPSGGSRVVLHAVVDAVGEEDTEGDASLERTGNDTSEVGRGSLGLIDRDETGESADTVTGEDSAPDELTV